MHSRSFDPASGALDSHSLPPHACDAVQCTFEVAVGGTKMYSWSAHTPCGMHRVMLCAASGRYVPFGHSAHVFVASSRSCPALHSRRVVVVVVAVVLVAVVRVVLVLVFVVLVFVVLETVVRVVLEAVVDVAVAVVLVVVVSVVAVVLVAVNVVLVVVVVVVVVLFKQWLVPSWLSDGPVFDQSSQYPFCVK